MPPQHGDHIGDDEGGRGPADEQRGDEGHSRHEAQHPARGVRGRSPPRPGTGGARRAGRRRSGLCYGASEVTKRMGQGSAEEPRPAASPPLSRDTPREGLPARPELRGLSPPHTHWAMPLLPHTGLAPSPVPSHTQGYSLLSHAQVFSLFHTRPWLFLFTGTAHTGLPPPHTLRVSPHTVPSNMQAGTQVYPFAQPGLAS